MHNRNSLGLLSYAPTPGVAKDGSCLSSSTLDYNKRNVNGLFLRSPAEDCGFCWLHSAYYALNMQKF